MSLLRTYAIEIRFIKESVQTEPPKSFCKSNPRFLNHEYPFFDVYVPNCDPQNQWSAGTYLNFWECQKFLGMPVFTSKVIQALKCLLLSMQIQTDGRIKVNTVMILIGIIGIDLSTPAV